MKNAEKDDKGLANAIAVLDEYVAARGMRRTQERYAILERVFATAAPQFVDVIYDRLEADGYHVSLSTVYSAMQVFEEAGLVRRHQFGSQPAQYERVIVGQTENHLYLVCNQCGRMRKVKVPDVAAQVKALRYPTFTQQYFTLYIYGVCSRCKRRKGM